MRFQFVSCCFLAHFIQPNRASGENDGKFVKTFFSRRNYINGNDFIFSIMLMICCWFWAVTHLLGGLWMCQNPEHNYWVELIVTIREYRLSLFKLKLYCFAEQFVVGSGFWSCSLFGGLMIGRMRYGLLDNFDMELNWDYLIVFCVSRLKMNGRE